MDSRKAHICNIQWEPCILDQERILFWSVLHNLHMHADPVTRILTRTICMGHYKKILSLCPEEVWDILESILFWTHYRISIWCRSRNTDFEMHGTLSTNNKFSVSRNCVRHLCKWHYQQIIQSLSSETVRDIYESEFWFGECLFIEFPYGCKTLETNLAAIQQLWDTQQIQSLCPRTAWDIYVSVPVSEKEETLFLVNHY